MEKMSLVSKLLERVQDTLDSVKPEQVLLKAIMDFQTTSVKDMQQNKLQESVDDLNLLADRIMLMNYELTALRSNPEYNEAAYNEVLRGIVNDTELLNDGLAAAKVIENAIELLTNSTAVEQLRSTKGRETVADLANVCKVFVRLREALAEHFTLSEAE